MASKCYLDVSVAVKLHENVSNLTFIWKIACLENFWILEQLPSNFLGNLVELVESPKNFKGGSKQFPALFSTSTLTNHYYHSFSVDATVLVLNRCPITGEQVMIIFLTLQVTIAMV